MNRGRRSPLSEPSTDAARKNTVSVPAPVPPAATSLATSSPIRIAVIDDSPEVLHGVAAVLGSASGIRSVGCYSGVRSALESLISNPADIVLIDLQMPEIDGVEGIPILQAAFPHTQFLVLTMFQGDDDIFRALSNGASGYLLKSDPPERILAYVREASQGGAPMSPAVARRVLQTFRKPARSKDSPSLTDKELAVLELLRSGIGYKGTAANLGLSIDTVRDYVRKIYQKLQVHSLVEALAKIDA